MEASAELREKLARQALRAEGAVPFGDESRFSHRTSWGKLEHTGLVRGRIATFDRRRTADDWTLGRSRRRTRSEDVAESRGGELPTADTRVRRSLTHTPAASSSGFDCQEAGARPLRAASADSVLRFPGGQRGQDLASLDRDAIKVVLTKGLQVKTRVQDPLPEEN
ncbi:unnamed protein product [Symbiodinium necroappetens]|uniref:Uncharacterized protein n=1 Tax=Symbiodinium necroappetens TaxID=1628268 RepID=A0A813A2P1_9DINO|nr:unnamed protein product [Symbiodinium necroappetens]